VIRCRSALGFGSLGVEAEYENLGTTQIEHKIRGAKLPQTGEIDEERMKMVENFG